ncbi:MAG: flagellar biosynthesis protein [Clostridia bacterium]|nr:flagellar biosynthesis protein [Clostridia bacterium]
MVVNNNYLNNIRRIQGTQPAPAAERRIAGTGSDFGQILQKKIDGNAELKLSKHAEMRLQMRNINLSREQKERISSAVAKAEQKGVKDSLVLMDEIALVVNTKSRTVITAVNKSELKDNVFTNIDGAVII